jgi:hypothetical protein
MNNLEEVFQLVEDLTGQPMPFSQNRSKFVDELPFADGGIGYSQLNELLLTLGYDRIQLPFFQYLFGKESTVCSIDQFTEGIRKFQKHAIFLYGNVKFAFKKLSSLNGKMLKQIIQTLQPIPLRDYEGRQSALHRIRSIPGDETYYLGYLVQKELDERLLADPKNETLKEQLKQVKRIRELGRLNHDAYLTYDHMDVYIATSMRERHEFYLVSDFVQKLFMREELASLNLRWFDPTQAYCEDRIDKGLVEALMLKRAKCTIYHVQEADTLGKDSELAATLAQGKPVIAFIPKLEKREEFIAMAKGAAATFYKEYSFKDLLLNKFLPLYYPEGAWKDKVVQGWLRGSTDFNPDQAADLLFEKAASMYDRRAATLKESHPLGLQVNLATGVSNGVLVVRSLADCALLLRSIMLSQMEFDLERKDISGKRCWYLREKISQSVYRIVTGDDFLTNSFWNFYLKAPSSSPAFL